MALNPKQRIRKPPKLTPKQKCFVAEYIIDKNKSQAALRAGYSPKTAPWIGQRLFSRSHIFEAIQKAVEKQAERTKVTADKVILGLAQGAFADIAACYDENGNLKNIHDIPIEVRMAIAGLDVEELFAGAGQDRVQIGNTKKLKMTDKHKYLDSLAKHFGMYNADKSQKPESPFIFVMNLHPESPDEDGI